MTRTAAAFPGVTAFDRPAFALAACRRAVWGGVVIGGGTVTATGLVAGVLGAAWVGGVCFVTHPDLRATAATILEPAGLTRPYSRLADAANLSGLAGNWSDPT